MLGFAGQYSPGYVLYECLTGRVPFEKDLDAAIVWAHVEEAPTMPTVLRPDLPPAIDDMFALFTAYQQQIRLSNGSFSQNTKTHCANQIAAYAETGWNHVEDHPTRYTVAQGSGAMAPLYTWWAQIHHVIIFPRTIMCGQNMAHMADAPQGNLISVPQCPAGVNPAPGTTMSGM